MFNLAPGPWTRRLSWRLQRRLQWGGVRRQPLQTSTSRMMPIHIQPPLSLPYEYLGGGALLGHHRDPIAYLSQDRKTPPGEI